MRGSGRVRREMQNEDGPPFRRGGIPFCKWDDRRVNEDFPRRLVRSMIADGYFLCDIRKSLRRRHVSPWIISYLFHQEKEYSCTRWYRDPCQLKDGLVYVKREKEIREKIYEVVPDAEQQQMDAERRASCVLSCVWQSQSDIGHGDWHQGDSGLGIEHSKA